MSESTGKPRLTGKAYQAYKLMMTQHGFNTDFYDAMAVFYTDAQRETHRMIANDKGQATNSTGEHILHFGPLPEQWDKKNDATTSKYVWVMDDSGNIYIDLHDRMKGIFHSAMMGGFRPICGGEICCFKGFIVMINNSSGHYAPPKGRLTEIVLPELEKQGFDLSHCKVFDLDHGTDVQRMPKENVRERLISVNKLASGLKLPATL